MQETRKQPEKLLPIEDLFAAPPSPREDQADVSMEGIRQILRYLVSVLHPIELS